MKKEFKKVTNALGYISASPLPSVEELERYYADIYYQQTPAATYQTTYSPEELEQKRLRAKLLIYAFEAARDGKDGKDFLEIGCGEGFVLQAAADAGFDVAGIDLSRFGVQTFHPHLADRLSTGDALELLDTRIKHGLKADVCVLQNILEHVLDPEALMARVKDVLKPGGLAAINVPNDFSALQKKLMELGDVDHDYWFLPPQHLHYFNVDTITPFLENAGFEVMDLFADFPIEMFLFHPGSNYAANADNGPNAHRARLLLDLLLAERGISNYYRLCQAMSGCGIGRNVCAIVRVKG